MPPPPSPPPPPPGLPPSPRPAQPPDLPWPPLPPPPSPRWEHIEEPSLVADAFTFLTINDADADPEGKAASSTYWWLVIRGGHALLRLMLALVLLLGLARLGIGLLELLRKVRRRELAEALPGAK